MATKNDEVILKLKVDIEAKKSKLATVKKFEPTTNCNLELDGRRYNLHVADQETLTLLAGKIQSYKDGLWKALQEPLVIGGYTADEWIGDIKGKFAVLTLSTEEKRLRELEKKLHNLLSTDKKVELEIEDLKSQI